MNKFVSLMVMAALLVPVASAAPKNKLTQEERIDLVRGLSAEYATAKIILPKSKHALSVTEMAKIGDLAKWSQSMRELGAAANVGDSIQVTRVDVNNDNIVLEINGGMRSGSKWYDHVQVGVGGGTAPVSRSNPGSQGLTLVVEFHEGVPSMTPQEFKKLMLPMMDFDKRSASEDYLENLPEPIRMAIKEKRAVEGMSREQVLDAVGHPRQKTRETKDSIEQEDWVYGLPPGKITFVTFEGDIVVKVRDTYAGLGGSTAPKLDPK